MKKNLRSKSMPPAKASKPAPGCGRQVVIRGVDVVEIVDLTQPYPPYPYYQCRVRAEVSYPAGSSPVGSPVAKIEQNGQVLVGNLSMSLQGAAWFTSQTAFSADPNLPIRACVTAQWMIISEDTGCSASTPLPHP